MRKIYTKYDLHVGFRYLNTAGSVIEIEFIDHLSGKIQESSPAWSGKYWSHVDDVVHLINRGTYKVVESSKKPLYEIY